MAVEGFAGFELDEHGVALGCCEEAEGELVSEVLVVDVKRVWCCDSGRRWVVGLPL